MLVFGNLITVLYICPDTSLGGSTRSLIDLIDSLKDKVQPIVLLPKAGPALSLFEEKGVECMVYPYTLLHQFKRTSWRKSILHPWRISIIRYLRTDWECAIQVSRAFRGRRIDIVHSNYSPVTIGCVLSRILKAKHVWHVREFLDLHFKCAILLGIKRLRRRISRADARVFISHSVYEHWQVKMQNSWVLWDAICSARMVPKILVEKQPFILFCSYRLTEAKGARIAIEAFGKSLLSTRGFRLKMVGNCDDAFQQSLLETAISQHCSDSVDFISCQDDVSVLFREASCFVMPSYYEGLGRVTAEAMLYGCPVVAHASGGTLDLVRNGITGHLFSSVEECASKMNLVCSTDQNSMIERAQRFVLENLSQEVYGKKIMEVYKTILYTHEVKS